LRESWKGEKIRLKSRFLKFFKKSLKKNNCILFNPYKTKKKKKKKEEKEKRRKRKNNKIVLDVIQKYKQLPI